MTEGAEIDSGQTLQPSEMLLFIWTYLLILDYFPFPFPLFFLVFLFLCLSNTHATTVGTR